VHCSTPPNRLVVIRFNGAFHAMTRRFRAIARPAASPIKRWVTLVALLAFFLQGLAVQTHIHPGSPAPVAKLASIHAATPAAPAKNQDPVDQCPLCQELVHAGTFIAPSAAALLAAPLATVRAIPLALLPTRAQSAPAFAWQSRAPPQN
jgi:hypothetical protein